MKYQKPTIVALAPAISAIQGACSSKGHTVTDTNPPSQCTGLTNGSAYEADE
jgi:hypothetical protein